VAAFKPRLLEKADASAAARVVAIGVDIGEVKATAGTRLERWDDIPPFAESYPRARKVIRSRIDALLRRLEKEAREGR